MCMGYCGSAATNARSNPPEAFLLEEIADIGQIRMTEWHQQIGFSAEILQGLGLLAGAHLRVAQFFDRNHTLTLKSFVKSLVDCTKASLDRYRQFTLLSRGS